MTKKTKKIIKDLEKRITALEGQVQTQPQNIEFNGNYELKSKNDIDYFFTKAHELIAKRSR